MLDTRPLLIQTDAGTTVSSDFPRLRRAAAQTLQVNLGYLCNLSCTHCHVNAGPKRTELMDLAMVELVLDYLRLHNICTLDLTGGAPEMNPHFRHLVTQARAMGVEVIDRCNLTILGEPGYEDMAEFLAQQQVVITASLPCYLEQNVEKQRGKGVYGESIRALKRLNELGYGRDPGLQLDLVYNPDGLSLPPAQQGLEADYKRELLATHGIVFNQLFTITNMPINRFRLHDGIVGMRAVVDKAASDRVHAASPAAGFACLNPAPHRNRRVPLQPTHNPVAHRAPPAPRHVQADHRSRRRRR